MVCSVDFLTVHFGDPAWTELLVRSIHRSNQNERLQIRNIHIVDNARDGLIKDRLSNETDLLFYKFPVDQDQLRHYFHDHAASLSRGVEKSDADILVILDCDAHILDPTFPDYLATKYFDEGFDAILASDMRSENEALSHPCYMALSRIARSITLPFDSRVLGSNVDVGRLIKSFLEDRGVHVHTPTRSRTFGGAWGEIFDGQVYHHGSATFRHSQHEILTKQVNDYAWLYEQSVIKYNRFKLSFWEKWYLRFHSRMRRLF